MDVSGNCNCFARPRADFRYSFLIEGIASVLVGVLCFFTLPDSPSHARWLTNDEAKFLELSHIAYRGIKATVQQDGVKKKWVNIEILKQVLCDWQLYLQAVLYWSNSVPNYGLKFTMPSIIRNMGFESTTAQLLTAPPYTLGAISAVLSALMADRLAWRMPFIVGFQVLVVTAFAVLFCFAAEIAHNIPLCYVMVCLACIGLYPIIPGSNAWAINNLAGAEKRAAGIGFMVSMSFARIPIL